MKTLLALLLLAAPALAQAQSAAALADAGCGPIETQFSVKTDRKNHPMGQPLPGKALVYVIESQPGYCLLNCFTTRVGLDGAWVGANRGTSYLYFSVAPGDHQICAQWQSSFKILSKQGSAITLQAEPGKTYYLQARLLEHENHAYEVLLVPLDPAQGQFLVGTVPYSIATQKKK